VAESKQWRPNFVNRDHPPGEVGINISLDEVAKRAVAGSMHPRVVTWARNTIEMARSRGEPANTPLDRARILLRAVQGKLWLPDPVGSEFIAGAHLLACDDEKDGQVCIKAADCDELVVLLAAVFSAVGIYTMIVGHAYDRERRIEHVLCAAHIDGRWRYADPSTKLPLGQCVTPFSRERLLSMPNVQVLCDERACLTTRSFEPNANNFVNKGVFVGVDGPPTLAGLAAPMAWLSDAPQMRWLGQNTAIDLKDPATLGDVKTMMSLIKPNYQDRQPTWSPTDWATYKLIVEAMAADMGFQTTGSFAYEENGDVVAGKVPPPGKVGFPSYVGIKNMGEFLVKLKVLKASDATALFPNIAKYGQYATTVTAPNMASSSPGRSSGAASLLLPLLLVGGIGAAIAVSSRHDATSSLDI